MGLFDKLKKDLFDMAKKAVVDAIEDKIGIDGDNRRPAAPTGRSTAVSSAAPTFADADAWFTQILSSDFPRYTVRRNARYDTSRPDAIPVTYLVCAENDPVLAVILCDKHLYGRKRLMVTLDACQAEGIPTQCYYTQFRNDRAYVTARLGEVLKN